MGNVGKVGDWKDDLVPVMIEKGKYFYDPDTGIWYNNKREMEFYIPFRLDRRKVYFEAERNRFLSEFFQVLSNVECADIEQAVKRKYNLNGYVSFFRP